MARSKWVSANGSGDAGNSSGAGKSVAGAGSDSALSPMGIVVSTLAVLIGVLVAVIIAARVNSFEAGIELDFSNESPTHWGLASISGIALAAGFTGLYLSASSHRHSPKKLAIIGGIGASVAIALTILLAHVTAA